MTFPCLSITLINLINSHH